MTMGAHSTVQVAGTRDKMLLSIRIQVKCLCVSSLNSAASPLLSEIASGHLIGYQQPRWSYEAEPTSLFLASLAALSEGLIWAPPTRCALNRELETETHNIQTPSEDGSGGSSIHSGSKAAVVQMAAVSSGCIHRSC